MRRLALKRFVTAALSLFSAFADRSPLPATLDLTMAEITDELCGPARDAV